MKYLVIIILGIFLILSSCDNTCNHTCDNKSYMRRLSMDYVVNSDMERLNDSLYNFLKKRNDSSIEEYYKFSSKKREQLDEINSKMVNYYGGIKKNGDFVEPCVNANDFLTDPDVKKTLKLFMFQYNDFISNNQNKNIFNAWSEHAKFIFSFLEPDKKSQFLTFPEVFYKEDLRLIEAENLFVNMNTFILMNEYQYYLGKLYGQESSNNEKSLFDMNSDNE